MGKGRIARKAAEASRFVLRTRHLEDVGAVDERAGGAAVGPFPQALRRVSNLDIGPALAPAPGADLGCSRGSG